MAENTNQSLDNQEKDLSEKDLHDIVLKQYELLNNQSHTIRQLQIDKDEMGEEFSFSKIFSIFKRDKNKPKEGKNGWLKAIGSFLYSFCVGFIRLIYSFRIPVIICTLLGLAAGIAIYVTSEKIYESKIVFASGVLTNDFYKSHSEVLGDAAKYSPFALAKALNISQDMAEKVKNIEFSVYTQYQAQKIVQVNDTTNAYVMYFPFFTLTYEVTDGSIMDEVEKGTYNYFANNNYSENLLKSERELIDEQLKEIEKGQQTNDSLNAAINKKISNQNKDQFFVKETGMDGKGIILSQEEEVDKILNAVYNINSRFTNDKKLIKEQQNKLENDKFEIVSHHTSGFKPIFPRVRHIALYTFYGFLLGTVIAFIIMVLKGLKSFLEKAEKTEKENK